MGGRRFRIRLLRFAAVVGVLISALLGAGPASATTTCLTPSGTFGSCATAAPSPSHPAVPAEKVDQGAPLDNRGGPPADVSAFTIFTVAAIVVGFAIALAASDG